MSANLVARPIEILLVEDNPADVRWAQEALREGRLLNRLHVVTDGVEALDFLRRKGKFADAPRPDLMMLDLGLPRQDGIAVLTEIRQDPELRDLNVAVLTTSEIHKKHIVANFNVQTDCFLLKPLDIQRFFDAVRCFDELRIVIAVAV